MKKVVKLLAITAVMSPAIYAANTAAVCRGVTVRTLKRQLLGSLKIVKDMTKDEIVKALKGYKDGSYGGAMKGVMKGQVAKLTDKDIEEIAEAHGKK